MLKESFILTFYIFITIKSYAVKSCILIVVLEITKSMLYNFFLIQISYENKEA